MEWELLQGTLEDTPDFDLICDEEEKNLVFRLSTTEPDPLYRLFYLNILKTKYELGWWEKSNDDGLKQDDRSLYKEFSGRCKQKGMPGFQRTAAIDCLRWRWHYVSKVEFTGKGHNMSLVRQETIEVAAATTRLPTNREATISFPARH